MELGTSRIISSVVRVMMGIIKIAKETAPANALNPPVIDTTTPKAKRPTTIEGTPVRASAMNLITPPRRLSPYSAR
jgi:hypothetical protein